MLNINKEIQELEDELANGVITESQYRTMVDDLEKQYEYEQENH